MRKKKDNELYKIRSPDWCLQSSVIQGDEEGGGGPAPSALASIP